MVKAGLGRQKQLKGSYTDLPIWGGCKGIEGRIYHAISSGSKMDAIILVLHCRAGYQVKNKDSFLVAQNFLSVLIYFMIHVADAL